MRGLKYWTVVCLILVLGCITFATSVKIKSFHVPEVIKHRTSIVLDCDFSLEEKDQDLVVKWFFNKINSSLVYQWIPGSNNRPQVLGILKDRGSLERVNAVNKTEKYRALHILEAGPDLSGNYTCMVSTIQGEDYQTKSMLVFVPERILVIKQLSSEEDTIKIQCTAEGVFPSPELKLISHKRELVETEITSQQLGNLYDITVSATLKALLEPEEFSCELRIPQANYTVKKETVIYPGNAGIQTSSNYWIIVSACIVLVCQIIWH